jgi:hypothetical protein
MNIIAVMQGEKIKQMFEKWSIIIKLLKVVDIYIMQSNRLVHI